MYDDVLHHRPNDKVVIVETREADCIFRSAIRGDGVMEVAADITIIHLRPHDD